MCDGLYTPYLLLPCLPLLISSFFLCHPYNPVISKSCTSNFVLFCRFICAFIPQSFALQLKAHCYKPGFPIDVTSPLSPPSIVVLLLVQSSRTLPPPYPYQMFNLVRQRCHLTENRMCRSWTSWARSKHPLMNVASCWHSSSRRMLRYSPYSYDYSVSTELVSAHIRYYPAILQICTYLYIL